MDEEDGQFPLLSFHDGLDLLGGGDSGFEPRESYLESTGNGTKAGGDFLLGGGESEPRPVLPDFCVSPAQGSTAGPLDPSLFRYGPVDLLNTPSPRKVSREEQRQAVRQQQQKNRAQEAWTRSNTGLQLGKENRSLGDALTRTSRNSRIVMHFPDIRNGLGTGTVKSNMSTTDDLEGKTTYKDISKTFFAVENEAAKRRSRKTTQNSDVSISASDLSTLALSLPDENETFQLCDAASLIAGTPSTTSEFAISSHQSDQLQNLINLDLDQNTSVYQQNMSGSLPVVVPATGNTQRGNTQDVGPHCFQQQNSNSGFWPSQDSISLFNIMNSNSLQSNDVMTSSNKNKDATFCSSPQDVVLPDCSSTYTPTSMNSDRASPFVPFDLLAGLQQQQQQKQPQQTSTNLDPNFVQWNNTACSVNSNVQLYQDPNGLLNQAGHDVPVQQQWQQQQGNNAPATSQTYKHQAPSTLSSHVANSNPGYTLPSSTSTPSQYVLPNARSSIATYPVPLPVTTVPPALYSRKRKLVFDHIPTRHSSVQERIKYWKMEGNLRTHGNPGLPVVSGMKVGQQGARQGLIYTDSQGSDGEEGDSGTGEEGLYGNPPLPRQLKGRAKDAESRKQELQSKSDTQECEVIEIDDDEDDIEAGFHKKSEETNSEARNGQFAVQTGGNKISSDRLSVANGQNPSHGFSEGAAMQGQDNLHNVQQLEGLTHLSGGGTPVAGLNILNANGEPQAAQLTDVQLQNRLVQLNGQSFVQQNSLMNLNGQSQQNYVAFGQNGMQLSTPPTGTFNAMQMQQQQQPLVSPNWAAGLPTPPSNPAVHSPWVQVLQFNPGMMHIESLNVAGNGNLPQQPGVAKQLAFPQQPGILAQSPLVGTSCVNGTRSIVSVPGTNCGVPANTGTALTMQPAVAEPMHFPGMSVAPPTPSLVQNNRQSGVVHQMAPPLLDSIPQPPNPAFQAPSQPVLKLPVTPITRSEDRMQRPKHFDIIKLQIGSFSVLNPDFNAKRKIVLKLMFGKRKMVYEYEAMRTEEDIQRGAQPTVSIDIPFSSIVGLKGFENTLIVEVNDQPSVVYGFKRPEDKNNVLLSGAMCYSKHRVKESSYKQIMSVPYHQLHLRSPLAEKVKQLLSASDSRFEIIQACPLVLMPSKVLTAPPPPPATAPPCGLDSSAGSYLSEAGPIQELWNCVDKCSTSVCQPQQQKHASLHDVVLTATASTPPPTSNATATPRKPAQNQQQNLGRGRATLPPQGCMCSKGGCRTTRCRCVVNLQECGPSCTCHKQSNCFNVLNQVVQLNLDVLQVRRDSCMLVNLPRISNLRKFLSQQVFLKCCQLIVYLRDCVPGKFRCPRAQCSNVFYFSWCCGKVCEAANPMSRHCETCRRCMDINTLHCEVCGHCHEKLASDQICPYKSHNTPVRQPPLHVAPGADRPLPPPPTELLPAPEKKLPLAAVSDSVLTSGGKPTQFIPISDAPLHGRYVLGSEPIGQRVMRVETQETSGRRVSEESERVDRQRLEFSGEQRISRVRRVPWEQGSGMKHVEGQYVGPRQTQDQVVQRLTGVEGQHQGRWKQVRAQALNVTGLDAPELPATNQKDATPRVKQEQDIDVIRSPRMIGSQELKEEERRKKQQKASTGSQAKGSGSAIKFTGMPRFNIVAKQRGSNTKADRRKRGRRLSKGRSAEKRNLAGEKCNIPTRILTQQPRCATNSDAGTARKPRPQDLVPSVLNTMSSSLVQDDPSSHSEDTLKSYMDALDSLFNNNNAGNSNSQGCVSLEPGPVLSSNNQTSSFSGFDLLAPFREETRTSGLEPREPRKSNKETSKEPEGIADGGEVDGAAMNGSPVKNKRKVSLLVQLLESESDTETKILPKLLSSTEEEKDDTAPGKAADLWEEQSLRESPKKYPPRRADQESIKPKTMTATGKKKAASKKTKKSVKTKRQIAESNSAIQNSQMSHHANESNYASGSQHANHANMSQFAIHANPANRSCAPNNSFSVENAFNYSDSDGMLRMVEMQQLPEKLFNVSTTEEAMDLECQKAVESIQMMTDEDLNYLSFLPPDDDSGAQIFPMDLDVRVEDNCGYGCRVLDEIKPCENLIQNNTAASLEDPEPDLEVRNVSEMKENNFIQVESQVDLDHLASQERKAGGVDIHPGGSNGFVEDIPEDISTQGSSMASPALTRSIGQILGRPLNTSSPIPFK